MSTLGAILTDTGAFVIDIVTSVAVLLKPYWWCFVMFAIWFCADLYYNLQKSRRERDERFEQVMAESKARLQQEIEDIEI